MAADSLSLASSMEVNDSTDYEDYGSTSEGEEGALQSSDRAHTYMKSSYEVGNIEARPMALLCFFSPHAWVLTCLQGHESTLLAHCWSLQVLRLDASGRTRKFYVRRRDLLREFRLQPRDLRRIDPTIDFAKTSPSITIKEDVLLLCLGGVR